MHHVARNSDRLLDREAEMNDLRKAAEQALEALEDTCDYLPARSGVEREVDEAITALRQALAQEKDT